MPIRSPRAIYQVNAIGRNYDDVPDQIDPSPEQTTGGTVLETYIKMKLGIGKFFGLAPLPYDDPILLGRFGGNGTNNGTEYYRNIGGFKVASYKLVSKSMFTIEEEYYDDVNQRLVVANGRFRTMSVGVPTGHSVHEFIDWMKQWNNNDQIRAIVTPKGRRIDTTVRLGRP